jgi:hypothetical protein
MIGMSEGHFWFRAAMRRMGTGERWWAAEIVVRAIGLLLLALCAGAAFWLYRSLHRPPPHPDGVLDFAAGALSVVCWWFGWAFALEGPALFKLVPLPARSWVPARRNM